MTPDPESASKSGSLSPLIGWIRINLDQVNVLFWGTEGLRWPSPCMSGLQLLLTWPCMWWLSPSSLQKHKEQRGSSTRMLGSCPGLGLGGSLAFNQVSILNELLFLTTLQNSTRYIIRKFFVESQNMSQKPVIQQLTRYLQYHFCHTKCRRAQVMPSRSFTERAEP